MSVGWCQPQRHHLNSFSQSEKMFEIQNLHLGKHHHRGEIESRKWGANVLLAAIEPLSLHKQNARDVKCGDGRESSSNSHSRVQIVTSRLQLVQSCQNWGSAVCLGEDETTTMMMKIFHGSQCLRQRIRWVSSSLDVWKFEIWMKNAFLYALVPSFFGVQITILQRVWKC